MLTAAIIANVFNKAQNDQGYLIELRCEPRQALNQFLTTLSADDIEAVKQIAMLSDAQLQNQLAAMPKAWSTKDAEGISEWVSWFEVVLHDGKDENDFSGWVARLADYLSEENMKDDGLAALAYLQSKSS